MDQPGGVIIVVSKELVVVCGGFMPKAVVQFHWLRLAGEVSFHPRWSPKRSVEFVEKLERTRRSLWGVPGR